MDNQSNNEPSVNITEMWELLEAAIPGPWKQGTSTHRLVGKDNYEVADFHHGHEQVLTAKMFNMMPLLLDELLLLRAKLAESEAACAHHAETVKGYMLEYAGDGLSLTEEMLAENERSWQRYLLALTASVRAHMEEDAALRDVETVVREEHTDCEQAAGHRANPGRVGACQVCNFLADLDAVRAKGGG